MNFSVPKFSVLWANTLNLEELLGNRLNRYSIVEQTTTSLSSSSNNQVPQTSLDILIARTLIVTKCKSAKKPHVNLLAQLVDDLRNIALSKDLEQKKHLTMILLGALIHRYLRILKNYNPYSVNFFGFKLQTANPENSRLFKALRTALKFSPKVNNDFLKHDLEILDVTTLIHALEAYKEYLYSKGANGQLVYTNYSANLSEKTDIGQQLQKLIDCYRVKGAATIRQFMAISFLKSLAEHLALENKQFSSDLEEWSCQLKKKHSDFTQLTLPMVIEHVNASPCSEAFKERMRYLLLTNHISDNFKKLDHQGLVSELNVCQTSYARRILFGGYCLLLKSPLVDRSLKFLLLGALKTNDQDVVELDEVDLYGGIHILKVWESKSKNAYLDCELFGDRKTLVSIIMTEDEALDRATRAPEDTQAFSPM